MTTQTFARAARFSDLQGVSLDDPARPFVYPPDLSDDRRRELLAGIEDRSILAIRFAAMVFRSGPNDHNLEVDPADDAGWAAMATVAAVDDEAILLRDHAERDTSKKVGVLLASREDRDDSGRRIVIDLPEIRDQKTMTDFVSGLLDKFSVNVDFTAAVCSVCSAGYARHERRIMPTCNHAIGQAYGGVRAVTYMRNIRRKELSFVNFGAIGGTHLRAAFSAQPQRPLMTTALFGALSDLLNAAIDRVASAGDQDRNTLVAGLAAAAELDEATTAQLLAGEKVMLSEGQVLAIAGYLGEDPEQIEDAQAQDAEGADDTNDNDSQDQGQEPEAEGDAMSAEDKAAFQKMKDDLRKAQEFAFKTAFNRAVADGKVPAALENEERTIFRAVYASDADLYSARFAKMPANPAYGSQAFGGNGGQPAAPEDSDAPQFTGRRGQAMSNSAAKAAVKYGHARLSSYKGVFGETDLPEPTRDPRAKLFGLT